MANTDFRGLSNTGINARLKQFLVLITTIVIGMILSLFING